MNRKINIALISLFLLISFIQSIYQFWDTPLFFSQSRQVVYFSIHIIFATFLSLLALILMIKEKSRFYLVIWLLFILRTISLSLPLFPEFSFNSLSSANMTFSIVQLVIMLALLISMLKDLRSEQLAPFNLNTSFFILRQPYNKSIHVTIVLALIFGWPYFVQLFSLRQQVFTNPIMIQTNLVHLFILLTYLIGSVAKNRMIYLSFFLLTAQLFIKLPEYLLLIYKGFETFNHRSSPGDMGFGVVFLVIGIYVLVCLVLIAIFMRSALQLINSNNETTVSPK